MVSSGEMNWKLLKGVCGLKFQAVTVLILQQELIVFFWTVMSKL
jgi:hypothetical protein